MSAELLDFDRELSRKRGIELLRRALVSTFRVGPHGYLTCARCKGSIGEPLGPHRPSLCEVAEALEKTEGLA